MKSFLLGVVCGLSLMAPAAWADPYPDRSALDNPMQFDNWKRQLEQESQQFRLDQLERRQQRMEEEQLEYRKTQHEERDRERSANDLKDFMRAHPYGQGFWESERSER